MKLHKKLEELMLVSFEWHLWTSSNLESKICDPYLDRLRGIRGKTRVNLIIKIEKNNAHDFDH